MEEPKSKIIRRRIRSTQEFDHVNREAETTTPLKRVAKKTVIKRNASLGYLPKVKLDNEIIENCSPNIQSNDTNIVTRSRSARKNKISPSNRVQTTSFVLTTSTDGEKRDSEIEFKTKKKRRRKIKSHHHESWASVTVSDILVQPVPSKKSLISLDSSIVECFLPAIDSKTNGETSVQQLDESFEICENGKSEKRNTYELESSTFPASQLPDVSSSTSNNNKMLTRKSVRFNTSNVRSRSSLFLLQDADGSRFFPKSPHVRKLSSKYMNLSKNECLSPVLKNRQSNSFGGLVEDAVDNREVSKHFNNSTFDVSDEHNISPNCNETSTGKESALKVTKRKSWNKPTQLEMYDSTVLDLISPPWNEKPFDDFPSSEEIKKEVSLVSNSTKLSAKKLNLETFEPLLQDADGSRLFPKSPHVGKLSSRYMNLSKNTCLSPILKNRQSNTFGGLVEDAVDNREVSKHSNNSTFDVSDEQNISPNCNETSSTGKKSELKVTKRKSCNKPTQLAMHDSTALDENEKPFDDYPSSEEIKKEVSPVSNSKKLSAQKLNLETFDPFSPFIKKKSPKKRVQIDHISVPGKTETNCSIKKTKLPNFALIHKKAFDKLENLKEMSERKTARAQLLLSGKKPDDTSNKGLSGNFTVKSPRVKIKSPRSRKMLRYSPKRKSLEKSKKLPVPTVTSIKLEKSKKLPVPTVTTIKSNHMKPSTSNPTPTKVPPKSNIPRLGVSNIPRKTTLTKLGFKAGPDGSKRTLQDAKKAVANKTQVKRNSLEARRNVTQTVRTNRRFELLMNMRKEKK